MNSPLRIVLVFGFVTLSLSFISPLNAVASNSGSISSSHSSQVQETTRMGDLTRATMAARQKVLEIQNQVAESEKKVVELRKQLSVINNIIPQLQAHMAEWNIAAIPSAPTPSVTSTETVATVTAPTKPTKPAPAPQPEQPGDFLSNFMTLLKKHWLYIAGGLLVALWLVSRAMK